MNGKLIAALVIVGVLAVAVVGLVSAQLVTTTPSPNAATQNGASTGGFFGWMGRMMGFRGTSYYGAAAPAYGLPANITVTDPNTSQTQTYQGYYGYGGCMRGFFP